MKTPIPAYLAEVLDVARPQDSGAPADYIPELAAADPERLGAAIATTTGAVYAAGDAEVEFSIQSISKPFAYALALLERGEERVMAAVGVEASGEAFNELSLEEGTNRPKNPMINVGAITTHSLIVADAAAPEQRVQRVLDFFSRLAGRPLHVDEEVCASELSSAHRNLAIAHMLANYGMIGDDAHGIVEGYTRQCSIAVTSRDLAVMAATLATGGVQPVTGERLMPPEVARLVMSVMGVAGMYDAVGTWFTAVGIPAKSGVAGGMVGVLPGQVGIGTFSPRLDEHGNSVRGQRVFEQLSTDMGMHLFGVDHPRQDSVRCGREGDREIFSLQGTVQFTAGAELLDLMEGCQEGTEVLLDVSRVNAFTAVGRRMALEGLHLLREDGHRILLRDPDGVLPEPDLGDGHRPEPAPAD